MHGGAAGGAINGRDLYLRLFEHVSLYLYDVCRWDHTAQVDINVIAGRSISIFVQLKLYMRCEVVPWPALTLHACDLSDLPQLAAADACIRMNRYGLQLRCTDARYNSWLEEGEEPEAGSWIPQQRQVMARERTVRPACRAAGGRRRNTSSSSSAAAVISTE